MSAPIKESQTLPFKRRLSKPETSPYVVISRVRGRRTIAGGIPESAKLMIGLRSPATRPDRHPRRRPAQRTKKCIGKNVRPATGPAIRWVAQGTPTESATKPAVNPARTRGLGRSKTVSFATERFCLILKATSRVACEKGLFLVDRILLEKEKSSHILHIFHLDNLLVLYNI